jgi:hypothetical protein
MGEVLFWTLRKCLGEVEFNNVAYLVWIKILSTMLKEMVRYNMLVDIYEYIDIFTYICINTCVIDVYLHLNIFVCIYIYIYIYINILIGTSSSCL